MKNFLTGRFLFGSAQPAAPLAHLLHLSGWSASGGRVGSVVLFAAAATLGGSAIPSAVLAQPVEAVALSPGLVIEPSGRLNDAPLVYEWINQVVTYKESGVEYKRECTDPSRRIPSSVIGPKVLVRSQEVTPYKESEPRLKARFVSRKIAPAKGLRVVIRNQIPGLDPSLTPFTDRKYDKGTQSEGFILSPGDRHEGKYLAVKDGVNSMTYEIKREGQVLETGEFKVTLQAQNRYSTRTETLPRDVYKITCPDYEKQQKEKNKKK
jgi:hypothetical protein